MSVKVVMHYVEGDGCTYSCEVNLPFEYESAEAALVEFERLFNEANVIDPKVGYCRGVFEFAGIEFGVSTFKDREFVSLPDFYTLDEWFEAQRIDR